MLTIEIVNYDWFLSNGIIESLKKEFNYLEQHLGWMKHTFVKHILIRSIETDPGDGRRRIMVSGISPDNVPTIIDILENVSEELNMKFSLNVPEIVRDLVIVPEFYREIVFERSRAPSS
ncbi:MAG: hypothetical protein KGH93_02125 [Patescibacteria group bacterium]|nr:hypothetical protein [Patescibacteria group bacterium]MDE1945975.1 hypothetical protein [Patescibacteria group bacterium]